VLPDQAKAVYAMLLSAKLSGATVNLFGINGPGCAITNIIMQ
jgi:hypothetical protein